MAATDHSRSRHPNTVIVDEWNRQIGKLNDRIFKLEGTVRKLRKELNKIKGERDVQRG